MCAKSSLLARAVSPFLSGVRLPARKPRASGLQGMTPMPSVAGRAGSSRAPPRGRPGCSGSASRRSAPSRAAPRRAAPSRTARRTCWRRRCSAPCPRARGRSARPASPRSACRRPSGGSGRGRRSPSAGGAARRRSTSKMCLRERPRSFGPSPIGEKTLVAITTSSRLAKSFSARPVTSSLAPSE